MFNSSLFPRSAVSPTHTATSPSPSARPMSPPIFSSFNSSPNFPQFLAGPAYSHPTTNASFPTNSTNHGFQKFEHNIGKFEGPSQFEPKFGGLPSPYDSARITKFEARYEPNLSNETSRDGLTNPQPPCQTSRSGQAPVSGHSESLMVQNGQCGPIP